MQITSPTIILDKKKCHHNIFLMAQKARAHNLIFRPHFKTHQSAIIGQWFRDFGVDKISVSSVEMAAYFVKNGWDDITIAFVFNILETQKLNDIAKIAKINILVDSIETIFYLDKHISENIGVFIKIDLGNKRTGVEYDSIVNISTLIDQLSKSKNLTFKGFIGHSGNSYKSKNKEEILSVHQNSLEKIKQLRSIYISKYPDIIFSIGDTPTNTVADDFTNIDEIRPGNFVFNDVKQVNMGVCSYEDVAIIVACPIVSKHSRRNEIIVYCGAIHLSKDFVIGKNGERLYGKVVFLNENGWTNPVDDVYVSELYQEHGVIKASHSFLFKAKIGDLIGIMPIHSCLTVSALKKYQTTDGDVIGTF
ncbi:MAG: alanine racemase [Bacteroidota bacterium]